MLLFLVSCTTEKTYTFEVTYTNAEKDTVTFKGYDYDFHEGTLSVASGKYKGNEIYGVRTYKLLSEK
jgi:hypothetical protein